VTSELMFELYSVPSLAYCVDSIMSFYRNNYHPTVPQDFMTNGLVISFNTSSTSVVPVLEGKGIMSHAKRFVPKLSYNPHFPYCSLIMKDPMGCRPNLRIYAKAHPTEISWFSNSRYATSIHRNSLKSLLIFRY
jgi:hypothetical protein